MKNKYPLIILTASLLIFYAFGFYRLAKFETADEHYWIQERIPQYWDAVSNGKWKKTLINDKPGVSLALISGIGMIFENHPDSYAKLEGHVNIYDPANTERLNFLFRLPLVIFSGLFCLYFFWIIKKITANRWLAIWFSIFILLSPILLGISRIINPDSLLWIFSAAAIFSFIAYLKFPEKKFIAYSALFLGFSLLSKYIATILFPFLFVLVFLHILQNFKKWNEENQAQKNILKFSIGYWLVIAGSLFIFSLFFPAIIFTKDYFQQKTVLTILNQLKFIFPLILLLNAFILMAARSFKKETLPIFFEKLILLKDFLAKFVYLFLSSVFILVLLNWVLGNDFLGLSGIPFDTRKDPAFSLALPLYQKIILEFYPLVFSLSPLIISALLFLWIRSIFKKNSLEWIVFPLSLFILIYIGASIWNNLLLTIRYDIVLYPLLFFIAATGVWEFVNLFPAFNSKKALLSFCIIGISAISLWQSKPFYFEYTNSLLPKKYLITGSWGEGGYEAAQYLNSLPDAKNLTLWSDYYGTCEFFVGRCIKAYTAGEFKNPIDYYALTRRGEIRYMFDHLRNPNNVDADKYYAKENPDWQLEINGRPDDFIKIFKAEEKILPDAYRVGFITDVHGYRTKKSDYDITPRSKKPLLNFVDKMNNSFRPDAIVIGGDFSEGSGRTEAQAIADFSALKEISESITGPDFFVLGNHEIRGFPLKKWLEMTGNAQSYYSYEKEGVRLIVLDGNDGCRDFFSNNSYCLSEEQFQWLEKTLDGPQIKTLVFIHSPVLDFLNNPGDRPILPKQTAKLRDIFSGHKVSAVFSGHTEKLYYEKIDGVEYFSFPGFYKSGLENAQPAWYGSFYEISVGENVAVKMFYQENPENENYQEMEIPSEKYEKPKKQ